MWIPKWIRGLLGKRKTDSTKQVLEDLRDTLAAQPEEKAEQITPDQVQSDDPYVRAMVAAAFNSGGMVIGNLDENGALKMTTHPIQEDGKK